MKKYNIIKFFLFIFITKYFLYSSQIQFEKYNIEDGLSQNTVYDIFQDSRDYIWVGTQGGLDKFNGYEFFNYEFEAGDTNSIVEGWVSCIKENINGTLLLGTTTGNIGWFDPYDEIGGKYDIYKNNKNIIKSPIRDILTYKNYIFIGTSQSGLCRYNKTDSTSIWYNKDSTTSYYFKNKTINYIYNKKEEKKLILCGRGLITLDIQTNQIEPAFKNLENLLGEPLDSLSITKIIKDDNDNWYISTWEDKGILVFNESIKFLNKIKPTIEKQINKDIPIKILDMVFDKDKNIWMSLFNYGISIYNPKEKTFNNIVPDPTDETSLSDQEIESIIVDKGGGLWLGGNRSLMRHDPEKKKFKLISTKEFSDIKSTMNDIWGLYIDNNEYLWVGSVYRGQGVDKINIKTKQTTNIIPPNAKKERGTSLWYIREDEDGRIWGRTQYGLFVSNISKTKFESVWEKSNIQKKETGRINRFLLDKNKRFWVFSEKKTWFVKHKGKNIEWTDVSIKNKQLKNIINIEQVIESNDKKTIYLKRSKNAELKTTGALFVMSAEDLSINKIYEDNEAKRKIPGFSVNTAIYESKNKDLWLTTYGEGITKLNQTTKEQTHFGVASGLPNSYIYCIYEDQNKNMWMSSNRGIIKMNTSEKTFRQFGLADGIQNLEYNAQSHTRSNDGSLFFGGLSGVNYFNPSTMKENKNKPTIIIESFSKTDSIFMLHKFNSLPETYNVNYYEKDLSFNFAALDYRDPERNEHAYIMEGYDNFWTHSGQRRYASYTNLPSGEYVFRVSGSNNDGVWNEEGASIIIKILPAPWETIWAYIAYVVFFAVGFYAYLKRQKQLQKKSLENKRKEEELEQARKFQLDMLPKHTPKDLGLDIAATIKTATEVGGDYYDFFPQKDGESLYVVVGDATGHGMTAGMMVSITKAGLYGIPAIPPNKVAKRLNRVIKNIDLGWNRMAFNMARFWKNKVEFSSAAMPPAYHYHGKTGTVDEYLLKGLPLGSIKNETFELKEFIFNDGDSIVFISDGLPEATNISGEMLGYDAVFKCVQKNGLLSAKDQMEALLSLGKNWLGTLQNQDDITIVVVKK